MTIAGKAIPKQTSGMWTANESACISRAWSRWCCSTGGSAEARTPPRLTSPQATSSSPPANSRLNKEKSHVGVLDGKAAIVTGSARGIGRATAELLAEQGAKVLINDLDADVAEQAASEIAGETSVFGGDLTKEGVPDQLIQKAVDEFGTIDIVVNNAGY